MRLDVGRFSVSLRTKLLNNSPLDDSDVRAIINVAYECTVEIWGTHYPSEAHGYRALATDLVDQFPSLGHGLLLDDAINLLRAKLVNKFKNTRRRSGHALMGSSPQFTRKQLPGFLPPQDDDPVSRCRLVNAVQDAEDPSTAMDDSFAVRRHMVVVEKRGMSQLAHHFKPLFCADGMWEEVRRLSGDNGIKEKNIEDISKLMYIVREKTGCRGGEEVASFLMTLGDDIDSYVTQDVAYPHLEEQPDGGRFAVTVEGREVAEVSGLEEALLLLVWGHHIFHDKYAAATRKGMVFVGRYVLGFLEVSVTTPLVVKKAYKSLGLAGILPRPAVSSGV